jgi:hypothetical protein
LWKRDADGDTGFPTSIVALFHGFYDHIDRILGGTLSTSWVNGFKSYAATRGEHFMFTTDDIRRPGTYWQMVSDIDADWPLALMGWMPIGGKMKPHWVAVEGYRFSTAHMDYLIDVECTYDIRSKWLC